MQLITLLVIVLCNNFISGRRIYDINSEFLKHPEFTTSNSNNIFSKPPTCKEDHRVKDLPGLSSSLLKHYAGHLPVSSEKNSGSLFYWLFEKPSNASNAPLIIWFNGGPGCSSLEGLFQEIGPFSVSPSLNLTLNPYSWHNIANIMFVDQPVGTGLSFPTNNESYATTEKQVDQNFLYFYQNEFLKLFPEYTRREIFLAGESYAGRYIPNIATHLLNNLPTLNLGGVAIGNGWTDPPTQYNYADFAEASGLVGSNQATVLINQYYEECLGNLNTSPGPCSAILDMILAQSSSGAATLNAYDFREYNTGQWPDGVQYIPLYLNQKAVRQAIHVTDSRTQDWTECSTPVYQSLVAEDSYSSLPQVSNLLQHNVPVLFYNGQFDLICNHLGTLEFLHHRLDDWSGSKSFKDAERFVWLSSKSQKPAGYVKGDVSSLSFVTFLGGGHMAPMDRPEEALDMITRFINQKSFDDSLQQFKVTDTAYSTNVAKKVEGSGSMTMMMTGAVLMVIATVAVLLVTFKKSQHRDLNYNRIV